MRAIVYKLILKICEWFMFFQLINWQPANSASNINQHCLSIKDFNFDMKLETRMNHTTSKN